VAQEFEECIDHFKAQRLTGYLLKSLLAHQDSHANTHVKNHGVINSDSTHGQNMKHIIKNSFPNAFIHNWAYQRIISNQRRLPSP